MNHSKLDGTATANFLLENDLTRLGASPTDNIYKQVVNLIESSVSIMADLFLCSALMKYQCWDCFGALKETK